MTHLGCFLTQFVHTCTQSRHSPHKHLVDQIPSFSSLIFIFSSKKDQNLFSSGKAFVQRREKFYYVPWIVAIRRGEDKKPAKVSSPKKFIAILAKCICRSHANISKVVVFGKVN